jgi:Zn-dependent M32 family carboxypeptidase
MKFTLKATVAAASCALLIACNTDKVPADAAIKAAEASVGAVKADAQKFAPEQLKAVETSLAAAKDQFAKGEYKAALAGATELSGKVKDLAAATATKKDELTKAWADLSAELPKSVEAVKAKVEELAKAKKLPKEISADAFTAAKDGLAKVEGAWKEATDAFGAGNFQDALAKGAAVKAKVAEIAGLLGIQAAPATAPAAPAAPAK